MKAKLRDLLIAFRLYTPMKKVYFFFFLDNYRYFRKRKIRSPKSQKEIWAEYLKKFSPNHEATTRLGPVKPEAVDPTYGNYRMIKDILLSKVHPQKTILEVGCFSGKWTQYLMGFGRVIGVDLDDSSGTYLKELFNNNPKFSFYKTAGNELKGIPDKSVNIIFSVDSLVRAPKNCIRDYFREFSRVLVPGTGEIMIHLPNWNTTLSKRLCFTKITSKNIFNFLRDNGFTDCSIENEIIFHGSLVFARKVADAEQTLVS